MPHFVDLPEELLGDIVARIHSTSPKTLPSLGLACKGLQRLTHPLQWEHIVLPWRLNKKSPIARFIESHPSNENIRSIRLRPQRSIMNAFRVGMKNAYDHLDALCGCLGSLPKLTTFSIFLEDQVDSRCYLPGPVLARIVRALPPSLLHLELDTECVDRIFEEKFSCESDDHLCLAINDRIPHLETLRLRISCLCSDLFRSLSPSATPQISSKLRRVFIRMDTSPGKESHLSVPVVVGDCASPDSRRLYRGSQGGHSALTMGKMMKHLLELQAAGAFPQLQRFIVWYGEHEPGASDSYCRVRDIATRSTTHYPKCTASRLTEWNLPEFDGLRFETLVMFRDHNQRDWVGLQKSIEGALLHEVSWKERADSVRSPPLGKLETVETRICEDDLLSMEYLRTKEAEQLASGQLHESKLPDPPAWNLAKVFVERV